MLAIGRALMGNPRLLMLDEPSLGLAPRLIDLLLGVVHRLPAEGAVLLVEQNVAKALALAGQAHPFLTAPSLRKNCATGRPLANSSISPCHRSPLGLAQAQGWTEGYGHGGGTRRGILVSYQAGHVSPPPRS
jgi:hypothetical protein